MENQARESEIKLGIPDAAGMERLIACAGGLCAARFLQRNDFFDTPSRDLARIGVGCRIRHQRELEREDRPPSSTYELTIKGPPLKRERSTHTERVELNVPIDEATARDVLGGRRSVWSALPERSGLDSEHRELLEEADAAIGSDGAVALRCLGGFENERRVVHTELEGADGAVAMRLELDRTSFPGDRIDFELEVELGMDDEVERHREALGRLFRSAKVAPLKRSSKLARFMNALDAGAESETRGSP